MQVKVWILLKEWGMNGPTSIEILQVFASEYAAHAELAELADPDCYIEEYEVIGNANL